ncbi:MAG: ArgE/DapE family deacylase [Deltaproteobacteria bacterium]|nr:ArgE/DapE family deacylase [Deltaproteobacteria bacterium]
MDHKEAFLRVEQEKNYLIDILKAMIAVNTCIPPGENYGKLVDILEPELRSFGFETRRVSVPEEKYRQIPESLSGERVNLVGVQKSNHPRSSFYGHLDVVPVDDRWTVDPFAGTVKEGKLYGRGAVDMKGSIAAFLGAARVIRAMGLEPRFQMECCFCTDEEVGVYPGARYLAEEGYFSNHLVWGELAAVAPATLIGVNGAARVDILALGRTCHSGMNWMGVNAVEEMVPVMQALIDVKKQVEKKTSRIPALPIPGAPSDKMTPMFNLTILRGGFKDNVVPGECRLTVNRRYIPEEKYEEVIAEIETAVKKGKAKSKLLDLKVDYYNLYSPVVIDPDSEAVKKMQAAAAAVWGYQHFLRGGITASSDLGIVLETLRAEQPQVACCGLLRPGITAAHGADEFVLLEDLIALTKQLVHYYVF